IATITIRFFFSLVIGVFTSALVSVIVCISILFKQYELFVYSFPHRIWCKRRALQAVAALARAPLRVPLQILNAEEAGCSLALWTPIALSSRTYFCSPRFSPWFSPRFSLWFPPRFAFWLPPLCPEASPPLRPAAAASSEVNSCALPL